MSKSRNIVVAVIIGLLVLAFALWGSEDVFNGQADNTVLSIGEEKVSANEYKRIYENRMRMISEQTGRGLTNEEAVAMNIPTGLVNALLNEKILLTDAKDLGIGYNARNALEELQQIPAFQDPIDKTYDYETARGILARNNISTQQYADEMTTRNRIEQLQPAINRGILTPEEFAETAYDFRLETREITVLNLTSDAVAAAPEPTDEQLQTYIDENIMDYTLPEYRRISMIRMEPTDFRYMDATALDGLRDVEKAKTVYSNIFVSEEEINDQYELTIVSENLVTPAKRSITVYQAENEDTAKTIAEKINDGLTQDEITALLGIQDPQIYTDKLKNELWDEIVADAAFEMADGEIKTIYGSLENWVTFQVTGLTEEIKPSKESIRDEVLAAIIKQKQLDTIYRKMGEVQEEIEKSRTIEEAAEIVGVPFSTLPYFDRSGITQDELTLSGSMRLPGISGDEEILRFVFTSNIGREIDIFDTVQGGTATIRVDSVLEATPKSFEASKTQAAIGWKDQYVDDALDDLMRELADRVTEGESLQDVAASVEAGAEISTMTLSRSQREPRLGQILWGSLIEGETGDMVQGFGPLVMTRQIAILDEIVPNTTPIPADEKAREVDRITSEIASDIMSAYQLAVIQEHPYTTNQAAVDRVLGLDNANP